MTAEDDVAREVETLFRRFEEAAEDTDPETMGRLVYALLHDATELALKYP